MIEFIDIKCDISGISKKHSGEASVARYGKKLNLNYSEDAQVQSILKKECKNKNIDITLFNVIKDIKNSLFIICKKSPHKSDYKAANGAACTQIYIGFNSIKMLESFIMSNLFDSYFYELNLTCYITYYIENNKCYNITNIPASNINIHQYLDKDIEYSFFERNNLLLIKKIRHLRILILIFLSKKEGIFSILHTNIENNNLIQLPNNKKDLYIQDSEYQVIFHKINKSITTKKSIKTMNSLNIEQIEDALTNINQSIDMNLRTIDSLSKALNNKNIFLNRIMKKSNINSQIDITASNAAKNIELLMNIQYKCLKLLEKKIEIE